MVQDASPRPDRAWQTDMLSDAVRLSQLVTSLAALLSCPVCEIEKLADLKLGRQQGILGQ